MKKPGSDTASEETTVEKMVHVINRSPTPFVHNEFKLAPHGDASVPESVANLWLGHKSFGQNLVALFNPKEVKARDEAAAAAAAEKKKLQDQLEESQGNEKTLTDQIANLQRQLEKAKKGLETKPADAPKTETKHVEPAAAEGKKAATDAAKK